jgi:hypothetical protein
MPIPGGWFSLTDEEPATIGQLGGHAGAHAADPYRTSGAHRTGGWALLDTAARAGQDGNAFADRL